MITTAFTAKKTRTIPPTKLNRSNQRPQSRIAATHPGIAMTANSAALSTLRPVTVRPAKIKTIARPMEAANRPASPPGEKVGAISRRVGTPLSGPILLPCVVVESCITVTPPNEPPAPDGHCYTSYARQSAIDKADYNGKPQQPKPRS